MNEDIKLAVKRGAYWLDEHYPEWEGLIDLATLDLRSPSHCVLGQIGERLHGGWTFYDMARDHGWGGDGEAHHHGFDVNGDDLTEDPGIFERYTEAWKEFIEERRAE